MGAPVCAIVTTVIGAVLVIVICVVGFVVVPDIVRDTIINVSVYNFAHSIKKLNY